MTSGVQQVIEDACKESDLVYTRHEGAHGGLPGIIVELPGERRLKTNTILSIPLLFFMGAGTHGLALF